MSETERFLSAASSIKSADNSVHRAASESTPLLSSSAATPQYDGSRDDGHNSDAASIVSHATNSTSIKSGKSKSIRWPSVIAMLVLAFLAFSVMVLAFFVPAAVEEYAKQATVLEPTNLSLVSITSDGVRARIRANFRLDAQRVVNEHVRRVGRAATWLVGELGTEETKINVYLPEYGDVLLGTASVPPLKVSIMDGRNNAVDFVADLTPGDAEGIRTIANEWLEGRLDAVRVRGQADIQLRAGMVPLGTHSIVESLTFEGQSLYRSFASLYLGEKSLF